MSATEMIFLEAIEFQDLNLLNYKYKRQPSDVENLLTMVVFRNEEVNVKSKDSHNKIYNLWRLYSWVTLFRMFKVPKLTRIDHVLTILSTILDKKFGINLRNLVKLDRKRKV